MEEAYQQMLSYKNHTISLFIGIVIADPVSCEIWYVVDGSSFALKQMSAESLSNCIDHDNSTNFLGGLSPENEELMNGIVLKNQFGKNRKNRIARNLRGLPPTSFVTMMDRIENGVEGEALMTLEAFREMKDRKPEF